MAAGEDKDMFNKRRKLAEYRIWGQGLRGSMLVLVQITGTVWGEIWTTVLFMTAISAIVTVVNEYFYVFDVPLTGHQVVLTPMSFLLVFRCSNSYARYWDGRSLLGSLVYNSREIMAKVACYTPLDADGDLFVENVKRYVLATALLINLTVAQHWKKVAHSRTLREGSTRADWVWDFSAVLQHLTQGEYDDLQAVEKNHPLVTLTWLRYEVNNALRVSHHITPLQEIEISSNVGDLQHVWNGMMKITTTPLPYPWVHMSRMVLWMFLVTLVFPAASVMGWYSIPFILASSFLFFGLVQIGTEMEDPFGNDINDFDLQAFEKTIQHDITMIKHTRERRYTREPKAPPRSIKSGPPTPHPLSPKFVSRRPSNEHEYTLPTRRVESTLSSPTRGAASLSPTYLGADSIVESAYNSALYELRSLH